MEDMIEIADNNATTVMPPVDYSGITRTDKDDENTIQVEKRDGRIVDFDKENIINAIMRAYKEVNHEIAAQDIDDIETIANEIEGDVKRKYAARPIEINEIQNLVEQSLLDDHKYDVATAYKDYRWKKDIQRAKQTDANEAVKRFMRKDKSIVNENANKDSRIYSTQRDLLAGTISKSAALSILPKDVANAYEKCDIHFHDADYSPFTAMSNCLARETRFITSKGIKSFEDFKDGDVVSVLAPSGKFQKAIVHNYGRQSLNEITFVRNGRTRRTIFATGNHRWILADGSETTELKEGDFIQYPPVHKPIDIENAPVNIMKAWVNGFIYGDGSERTLKNGNSICDLRLCGDKNDYIKVFEKLGYYPTYPQYAHGDATFYIRGFHKTPDIENMSTDEINAFFDGYMAADGAYTNNNNEYKATIMSSNKLDNFNIIENYSAIAGYHISSIKDMTGQITNYTDENGRKPTNIYRFIIGNHNKWKVESIKPSDRTEDVWCLEVENEHAFVLDGGIVTGNCSLPNFKDMLKNGFALGNAEMASPNSIETAATQVTQIMLDVASSQYGGQTLNRADETLAPYAMKNYAKNLEMAKMVLPDGMDASQAAAIVRSLKASENSRLHCEGRPEIKDEPEPDITNELDKQRDLYAKILTRKNIYDAMQTLEYQINTQHATCGQTPFVTVGFGLGTSWASREITRCILLIRIGGLGKDHRTAIFPKLTYTIKHGINSETQDPNYDLKQLALECTSKRMYPDILFYENIVNITGSFKAPMGAVDGDEIITWSDGNNVYTDSFKTMWNKLAMRYMPLHQGTDGDDWYIDLPKNITIKDSHDGTAKFVQVKRIINNQPRKWYRIKFNGGRAIDCTDDHPFEVNGKGRVLARNLVIGDTIDKADDAHTASIMNTNSYSYRADKAWLLGLIIADGCLNENSEVLVSFADKSENEISDKIHSIYSDDRLRDIHHDRGRKGIYNEIAIKDSALRNLCISEFNGMIKNDREIPSSIMNADRSTRAAFLGGLIDADGYVNKKGNVQIGSTNRKLAIGQMLLAESLGINARMYLNHYKGKNYDLIRYQVSFPATSEVMDNVVCAKKHAHFNADNIVKPVDIAISVSSIEEIDSNARSYDVTTETDYFDVSGIVSHNCRSFLQGWINPETGEDEEEGRFNLGVVTVNIPRIAIESKGNVKRFWKLFDERMNVAHHALQYRIKRCREALPENAPVLWENGAFGRLKPGDDVDSLMRNSRATLSLGYIGLYEATAMFYGRDWINNWGWDEDAYDFEISILKKMTDLCKEWEKDEGYHYSVYATPSESLTDRFSRADRAKFGRIPGITDHDFYTNSFHRPVWLSGNPEGTPSESVQEVMNRPHFHNANNGGAFSKLDFEEPFLKYTAGGHIVYTEEPMLVNNLRALEAVWDYAHEIGVDYLGTNTPIDSCMVCGYKGDFDPTETGYKCPQCGNDDPDKCDVVKRVCGYLGQPQQRKMVHGRHEELAHRAKHMDGETGVIRLADGTEELSFKDRAEKM